MSILSPGFLWVLSIYVLYFHLPQYLVPQTGIYVIGHHQILFILQTWKVEVQEEYDLRNYNLLMAKKEIIPRTSGLTIIL